MNMRRKLIMIALLSILACGLVGAVDFGAELSNTGGVEDTVDFDWYTEHKASLWMTVPFDKSNRNSLSVEGSLFAEKPAQSDDYTFYLNLDLFRFTVMPNPDAQSGFSFNIGRFPVSDVTGYIVSQKLDGVGFDGTFTFGNISFFAGYTGLLNARETGAMMSVDDYLDSDTDDIYALGAKRAVGKLTAHFPELIGSTDFIIEGLGQFDLRDQIDSDAIETVHTAYGTVMFTGPITSAVFYTLSATYQTGLKDSDKEYSENAGLAAARIDAYPIPMNHFFGSLLYTTAEGDFFTTFLPITVQTPGAMYGSGYSNIMKASAGWQFNPRQYLNFDLTGNVFMFPEEPEGGDGLYGASEVSAGATFSVTSDLNFRLDGTLLFPKDEDMQYQAALKAVLGL